LTWKEHLGFIELPFQADSSLFFSPEPSLRMRTVISMCNPLERGSIKPQTSFFALRERDKRSIKPQVLFFAFLERDQSSNLDAVIAVCGTIIVPMHHNK
jgi:hypothetical protein